MNDHKQGWVSREQISIPPIEKKGYPSMVLIRPTTRHVEIKTSRPVLRPFVYRLKTDEKIAVTADAFVLGKGSQADYIIGGNSAISRTHVRISKRDDHYYLEDLGSSNHTYVNDDLLKGEVALEDGMLFQMADETFRFALEGGQEDA